MSKKSSKQAEREAIIIPPEFNLDDDLAMAYNAMEFGSNTLFLTGRAGTGKSTLLNYFRKTTAKKYVVLAPTGLAALQVGGSTIHSFFGFPLRTLIKNDPEIRAWSKGHPRLRILRAMDTLIIDEVSMVRVDVMDAIDQSLRINMGIDLPFGGKQLIFIGDVFQLSPVVTNQDYHHETSTDYASQYFFSADVFIGNKPHVIELKTIYRQKDEDFIYLLNRIRMGHATEDDLNEINKRYTTESFGDDEMAIVLTSVNAAADSVNMQKLLMLRTESFSFKSIVEGTFHERLFPVSSTMNLKVGAQVMMVKNDLEGRWVNGSIGKIYELSAREIKVQFATGDIYRVEPVVWENKTYKWDSETSSISFEVLGTYTQYPIKLAWAITIHKSQGLTFEKVAIDLGRGAFAHGQLYVALSRCKTLGGIRLKTRINHKDMIVDEAVGYFASRNRIG
ncbi:MAG TPA: AAA family ATPase [Cyclobacteriaceae bacterium]|nr:AAA family ATPase [Cyclobacteriaceae bacterium]